MASYKSGFDPPTRPGEVARSRRLGTYIAPGLSRSDHREADIAHISGQMGSRTAPISINRPQHTGPPKPSGLAPSPLAKSMPEARSVGTTGSRFGFRKPPAKTAVEPPPDLATKTSRNRLRRKPSSIAQHSGATRSPVSRSESTSPTKWSGQSSGNYQGIEASLKSEEQYHDVFTKIPLTRDRPQIIPELDRYRTRPERPPWPSFTTEVPRLATQDLPSPASQHSGTPLYPTLSNNRHSAYSASGYSASPSTRFSESPGPGTYSRDTTPTSMSSQSPGILAPLKTNTPRLRQGSPAIIRPPITRRRANSNTNEPEGPMVDPRGLPSLRESLNSSSSNSTVKDGERDTKSKEKKKKKKRLSPLPPSPPPRKSSQKFNKPNSEVQESPSKPSHAPAKPVMTFPETSPFKKRDATTTSLNKSTPPLRPSREGAPDLQGQLGESIAVIQSNLVGVSFSQERRRSILPRSAGVSPSLGPASPPQPGYKFVSRNASPSPVQPVLREATPAPAGLGIIPDLRPPQRPSTSKSPELRTPSPSIANTRPRFGLFGRRAKTAPEVMQVEKKEKSLRKGPAAGTGHEGYGKYGLRGRGSISGGISRAPDRSLSSTRSSPQDHFFLERMSPVVIAGGGEIIENRNTSSEFSRSESNTSLLLGRPSTGSSSHMSSKTNLSGEVTRATLWPSVLPKESTEQESAFVMPKNRRPSDSTDDGKSSLAFRRSIQRLNNSTSALSLPKPLNIPGMGMSSSMTSLDASVLSDESQMDRGRKLAPNKLTKRQKSPKKWNLFHRSQKTPDPEPQVQTALQVVVRKESSARLVAHYAMLDSSDEQQDANTLDLEDILREADVVDLSNEELDALQFGTSEEDLKSKRDIKITRPPELAHLANDALMSSSPEPIRSTPEISSQTNLHLTKETAPVRPSRLPQVGRIPKVISARPEQTSPKSFSRPFARISTLQPLPGPIVLDQQSVGLGPSPPKPSTPELNPAEQLRSPKGREESGDSKSDTTSGSHRDFLNFTQRKNSETTTSSSGGWSFAGTTAVIPEPGAALEEDEVWDEYDDLIENNNAKVPPSATSSRGFPFQYESYETRAIQNSEDKAEESPTIVKTTFVKEASPRLRAAPMMVQTPTTPMSFTDFFAAYGDRSHSNAGDSGGRKARRHSRGSSQKSTSTIEHSRTSSESRLMNVVEQEQNSPISQVNLRVGSMTVSKWLTFGHVLFSPAREELMQLEGPAQRHSVLVIDGLGNDDWSFYAAETYPSATFYNLSPTRPLAASTTSQQPSANAFPLTPENHRQVQYLSTLDKFPFPRDTFTTVVVRFPTSSSEASYRNIIAESKRVLKPAGYLELSILDLDMMNMGNRARRAVRGLKVQMQVANPSISLASASDTILRLIGKRGFHDIKSCKVGVPVASTVTKTTSSSSQSQSSSSKSKQHEQQQQQPETEISLADMMKDESRAGDEGITKMVAKVGRWWYTRCYEMAVLPDDGDDRGSRSIFNDANLLAECKRWNTSFKLVVAYAQKPVVPRRRTASV